MQHNTTNITSSVTEFSGHIWRHIFHQWILPRA